MRQQIHIVLGPIALSHAVETLPQEFGHLVTDEMLLPWVVQLLGQRGRQAEPMISLPQQHHSRVRSQSIVAPLDLDRTIERGLEEGPLPFTHGMNLHARSATVSKRSERRPN